MSLPFRPERLLPSVLAPLVALALVAGDSPAAAAAAADRVQLVGPRVCPSELFSSRLQACTRDHRDAPLATKGFACSVTVVADRPATLDVAVRYEGGAVTGRRTIRTRPGVFRAWFAYNVGANVPLPSGSWSCTFALGRTRLTVPFRTAGPTGNVVNLVVCDGAHTSGSHRKGICRSDQSVSGLPPRPRVIVCSLYVTHRAGAVPTIEILDGTGSVVSSFTGRRVPSTLAPVWSWTSAQASGRPTFAPGAYACRVSLDGEVVATRPFSVRA